MQMQGRYTEAEPIYLHVLATRQTLLCESHADSLNTLHYIASLYKNQGRYEESEQRYLQVIAKRSELLGADHSSTLGAMRELAVMYDLWGQHDRAVRVYEDVLAASSAFAPEHPFQIETSYELSQSYAALGNQARARVLAAGAIKLARQNASSQDDPAALDRYARMLLECLPPDLRDAETALSVALEANRLSGLENWKQLSTLALAYHRAGQTEQAIQTQTKVVALLPASDRRNRPGEERRLELYRRG